VSESSKKHKASAPTDIDFALIMCSTSRSNARKTDKPITDASGDLIAKTLEDNNKKLLSRILVADEVGEISTALNDSLNINNVKAVIICGGTGISHKDVTIEAVSPMLDKVLPGFGEIFRKLSYDKIGSSAIMSRAIAGIIDDKVIFCIPGSIDAVKLCLNNLILPETGHILKHARENS
jgi:molybdenum cofactor biosynthesis protein B